MDRVIFAGVVLTTLLAGAAVGRTFEFCSGGAYHFEGHGAWTVAVNDAGKMSVTHNVRDEDLRSYGPYTLTEAEVAELWGMVDAVDAAGISFPKRAGVPDEVRFRFEVHGEGEDVVLKVWVNDARENAGLVGLVNYCGDLIRQYTGAEAVLW